MILTFAEGLSAELLLTWNLPEQKRRANIESLPFKSVRKIFFTAYFAFGGFTVRMSAAAMKHITPEITKELT